MDGINGQLMEVIGAPAHSETPPEDLRRSTRVRKDIDRLTYAMELEIKSASNNKSIPGEIFCLSTMFPKDDASTDQ
jgi:hypothetical protein